LNQFSGVAAEDVIRDKQFRKLMKSFVPDCMFHYGRDMSLSTASIGSSFSCDLYHLRLPLKYGQPGSSPVVPAKTHFEQVHRVSFDHESNLVKTPFAGTVLGV
jgi:hypothetical protein